VEQTPVDEAPPDLAAADDQRVTARLDRHHHQGGTEVAQMRHVLTIQAALPLLAAMAQASPTQAPAAFA
jgi:hypothetical protein